MKNQVSSLVAGAVVIALGAAVWILMPSFQASDRVLAERLDRTGERVRRLLDAYEGSHDLVLTEVAQLGSGGELDDARITNLVENDSKTVESSLKEESQRLDAMWRPAKSRRMQIDQKYNDLSPGSPAPRQISSSFPTNANGMSREMIEGVRQRAKLLADNDARLASAEAELRSALAETEGNASGADHLYANRLAGIAYYQQGSTARRRADLLRREADNALESLSASSVRLEALRMGTRLVESSGIDDAIAKQEGVVADARKKLDDLDAQIAALTSKIDSLNRNIDTQNELAEAARAKMEAMEDRGLDYEEPNAAEQFRQEYEVFAAQYRDTVRRAQALQFGTLDNARLDDSSDFGHGGFVPDTEGGEIEYVPGLDEYEREREAVVATRKSLEVWFNEANGGLARLHELRTEYQTRAGRAKSNLDELQAAARDAFERYTGIAEQLAAAEDEAIAKFERAARSFRKTQQVADRRVTDLPNDLSGQAKEASPVSLIENDRWLGAQATCQRADASVAAAIVLYDRYTQGSKAARIIGDAADRRAISDWNAAPLQDAIADAKERGEALIEEAIDDYGRAYRSLERHWTVVASFAGANYLLSLFDRPDALEVALQNYRNVVKDREDEPFVRPYLDRLQQLRNR